MVSNTLPLVFDGGLYTIHGTDCENVSGLVVFLDALGIKGIWKTEDGSKVLENWYKVYSIFDDG
jgi:hypothetical protein